jgi:hypothetical protein
MLPLVWTLAIAGLLLWYYHAWGFDDPYITFRYAENIAQGNGFVYNSGDTTLSTTTPLMTLLLALVGLVGIDIPLAGAIIGCISLALGGLVLWAIADRWQARLVGATALLLYPISPLLVQTIAAETTLYLLLILVGFLALVHDKYAVAGVFLALATITRADGILAAACAGGYLLWFRQWRAILALSVGFLAGMLPWLVYALATFGSPFPVTLYAKQQQGLMQGRHQFFDAFIIMGVDMLSRFSARWLGVLAIVGIAGLVKNPRWLLLIGWNVLYFAGYSILGVASYFWYYAPLVIGLVVLVGMGVEMLYEAVACRFSRRWATVLVAVLLLVTVIPRLDRIHTIQRSPDPRLPIYIDVGTWLRTHTPPDASVGTLEIGIIGYHAQRDIIDFAGLLQPDIAAQLSTTRDFNDSSLWAFHHYHPDYLVLRDGKFTAIEQDETFQTICQSQATFETSRYKYVLVIYACSW